MLLFVKAPVKGRVKSRLARDLGGETAVRLYESFVLDLIATLQEGTVPFRICFAPAEDHERITAWLGERHSFMPQQGSGLGERMENALRQVFSEGITEALIIGSDIPDLPCAILEEAFASLERHGAVIGPATDGGYYLIGFRASAFIPHVFRGIAWSTGAVFRKTMDVFGRHGCDVHVLPERQDVDTLDDLKDLIRRNRTTRSGAMRTMSLLREEMPGRFTAA